MRHALVTGGAGFIGSHLVDRLLGEGCRVTTVDNFDRFYDPAVKRANTAAHLQHPGFRLAEVDVRDQPALAAVEGDFDVIVHLAARAGVRPSIEDPVGYQQTNVQGTQNLLEFARVRGVKQFVFGSSSSVYGVNPNVPWKEDDHVLLPISPYAATKVAGELLGHVYSYLYGMRFIALRFFTVYGPRQRPDLAILKFARLMREGARIPIYGDGSSERDYTYIDDIVSGIRAAIDYQASPYEVINLGNHQNIGLLDMIRMLESALGLKASLAFQPVQPGDVPVTWASIRNAQRLLGWQPRTPFPEGISRFAQWIEQQL